MSRSITLLEDFLERQTLDLFAISSFLSILESAVFALELTADVLGFQEPAHQQAWNLNLYQQSHPDPALMQLTPQTTSSVHANLPLILRTGKALHSCICLAEGFKKCAV